MTLAGISGYHLCPLGLAALGTLVCAAVDGRPRAVPALFALGAMALAMTGGPLAFLAGSGLLLLLAPAALRDPDPKLGTHRALSHVVMAGVLGALFMLNGAGFCAAGALPLLSPSGITLPPMTRLAQGVIVAAAVSLGLYALHCAITCLGAVRARRPAVLAEVVPMALATIGMGVGAS